MTSGDSSLPNETYRALCPCGWASPDRLTDASAQADARGHAGETGHAFDFMGVQDPEIREVIRRAIESPPSAEIKALQEEWARKDRERETLAEAWRQPMIDAHFPLKGPCFCCGEQDGRHRLLDAIKGRHGAGDSVEELVRDYGRSAEVICAVLGFRQGADHDCYRESGVTFDKKNVQGLDTAGIQTRYPRKSCPRCGRICYASFEHYVMGDW